LLLQCSLRQLDLTLLGQLWSLNESIQEFRQIFQDDDQDGGAMSPGALSPGAMSPGALSPDSAASSEDDEFYSLRYRPPAGTGSVRDQVAVDRLYHHSGSSSRSSTVDFGDVWLFIPKVRLGYVVLVVNLKSCCRKSGISKISSFGMKVLSEMILYLSKICPHKIYFYLRKIRFCI